MTLFECFGRARRHRASLVMILAALVAAACKHSASADGSSVSAPSSLAATAASTTQINLAWTDNSNNEDGFRIEQAPGNTTSFVEVGTVGAGVTIFQSSGLQGSTAYSYRVRAYNASAISDYSSTATATTLLAAPTAPSGLSALAASSSQINLAWSDNSNSEDGFRIEQSTTGNSNFTEIATVGAGVTAYQSTGLNPSSSYTYRVRAYNAAGLSAYSNSAAGFTSALPVAPPAAPSGLTATAVSGNLINLSWADNSSNETGFRVERAPGGTTQFVEIGTANAGVTTYQSAGLTASTAYDYRVRAYNQSGNSSYSATASATTSGNTTPPAAPSNLGATVVSSTEIDLSWTDNSSDEDGFRIERAPGGTSTFAEIAVVGHGVTTYQSTGLAASSAYSYRVRAYNSAGTSAYTAAAGATTNPASVTPPIAPSGLSATAVSATQVNLAWTDNSSDEDGFRIERAPGGTLAFTEIGTVSAGVTAYQSTGLSASTQYVYRVRAYNAAGNSAYTSTAPATTLAGAALPTAPSNLQTVAIGPSEIDLTWNDNSSNEDGFRIERSPDGVNFTQIGTVGANVVLYWDQGLPASTSYTYRIRAYNSGGTSAYSNTASGSTTPNPPAAPTSLGATPVSSTQINLSWTDNSSNETGFQVDRAPGGTTSFSLVAQVGPNVTTYQNTGLSASTSYTYRVRAYNAGGYSASSNQVTASTTAGILPPTAPSTLTATAASETSITLAWHDNSSNEDGFTVEQAPGGTTSFTVLATVPAGTTTVTNNSLPQGTKYSYRVKAYNAGGSSAYTNTASATTWAIVYASAANAMETESVNGGGDDGSYGNNVYSTGKIGIGCNVVVGYTSVAACISSALQFSGFATAVSGKTIATAYLRLYPSDLAHDLNTVYGAFLFAVAWSPSSLTYNNSPSYYSSPSALHGPPNSASPIDFDVTTLVQNWVGTGAVANDGILLGPTSTGAGGVVSTTFFWSDDTYNGNAALRPQLIILFQ